MANIRQERDICGQQSQIIKQLSVAVGIVGSVVIVVIPAEAAAAAAAAGIVATDRSRSVIVHGPASFPSRSLQASGNHKGDRNRRQELAPAKPRRGPAALRNAAVFGWVQRDMGPIPDCARRCALGLALRLALGLVTPSRACAMVSALFWRRGLGTRDAGGPVGRRRRRRRRKESLVGSLR